MVVQKPNNNNSRTYTKSNTNTRSMPQVKQRTSQSKPRAAEQRTVTRSTQSKPMATQSRGNSGNKNTRSEAPTRRRS